MRINQQLSNNKTYAKQTNLKGYELAKFWLKIYYNYWLADRKLKESVKKGVCYYGPFKGEFGHMTAHTAPFLMYLHKLGVKIIYCGMELHLPLLVNSDGESIIHDFRPLRDFFSEVPPKSNSTIPPRDVQVEIERFNKEANSSEFPFWNIGDDFYYWFIHRNWLLKGHTYVYNLEKAYKTKDETSVCVFPRSKGAKSSHNNGESWDYDELVDLLSQYFDKVYVTGHPSQVLDIKPRNNVEICITSDNAKILEKCANSKLIVTQHSGVNNLGEYINSKVLIIYKGGKTVEDIGSMGNTLRFRPSIGTRHELSFAFNLEEVKLFSREFVKAFKKEKVEG